MRRFTTPHWPNRVKARDSPPSFRTGCGHLQLRVNEVVGVAGFAVAGMHVDVLVAGVPPGGSAQGAGSISRTLLQNISVLSAGQNYQKDAEGKPVLVQVVNLLVTPAPGRDPESRDRSSGFSGFWSLT